MIITGNEARILRNLETWLEKRRIQYRDYFNKNRNDTIHMAKMGELVNILDKIDDLKGKYMP